MRRLLVSGLVLVGCATLAAACDGGDDSSDNGDGGDTSTAADLRVVNLNVLHGIICPMETNGCQRPDRLALLGERLEAAQCPEVVGLQEVNPAVFQDLMQLPVLERCGYESVLPPPTSVDHELVLTSLTVTGTHVELLPGEFRSASRVELDSAVGEVVLVVTHQDGDPDAPRPVEDFCTEQTCPPECPTGSPLQACQTVVADRLADEAGGSDAIRILMGDFNVTPASDRYRTLIDDGWTDSHLAADNPECDAATGAGCTSGRRDNVLDDLQNPDAQQVERIDFMFVKAPDSCATVFDGPDDDDGDGLGTGIWDDPAVGGPGGMVFVSDHSGTSIDLSCGED